MSRTDRLLEQHELTDPTAGNGKAVKRCGHRPASCGLTQLHGKGQGAAGKTNADLIERRVIAAMTAPAGCVSSATIVAFLQRRYVPIGCMVVWYAFTGRA